MSRSKKNTAAQVPASDEAMNLVPVVVETAPVLEVPVEFETFTVVVETVPVEFETETVVVETVPVVVETFTVAVETATVLEVPVVEEVVPVEVSSIPSLVSQLSALNTAAPEVKVKTKTKNENVYGNVKILFNAGKTNKETLAEIHEMYGNTNTTYACIAWYRNKYNKEAKSTKMTVEQLLNQIGCEFGLDQDWIKTKLSLI